ncbi:MAG TPA: hypothetical protein PK200_11805 [Spirochaetota bacterium]|nr:hypothetical protein [Spirochaetota bacterium]HQO03785.1 hypothetical protein [Spirochaetota bacterium]HQP49620.1 hypothetical protein [Spirochaetota bacterium]
MNNGNGQREKIGQYLVRLDYLSFEQAEEVLRIQQENPGRKFGDIAVELGYIDREILEEYIAAQ